MDKNIKTIYQCLVDGKFDGHKFEDKSVRNFTKWIRIGIAAKPTGTKWDEILHPLKTCDEWQRLLYKYEVVCESTD